MEERFIRIERTLRYHLIGDLRNCRQLWIVLHGYGQLARFFLNNFNGMSEGRCIAAPEGTSRFYLDPGHSRVGASWMTREDRIHEIEDQVRYLDRLTEELLRQAPAVKAVHVLGFSQGVATVARWSVRTRLPIARMVLWAGSLPAEMDKKALVAWRDRHVDLVLGDQDEYAGPESLKAMAQLLASAEVPHRTHSFQGTHRLEPALLKRLLDQD